jgi:hypothetical protein
MLAINPAGLAFALSPVTTANARSTSLPQSRTSSFPTPPLRLPLAKHILPSSVRAPFPPLPAPLLCSYAFLKAKITPLFSLLVMPLL